MHEQLWFTAILNHYLQAPVTALLRLFHVNPAFPDAPIHNSFAMEILVFMFLVTLFAAARMRLSVDRPGALQHALEGMNGFIQGQSEEIIGDHSEGFTPFLVILAMFILISNLIGLIPSLESPTASPVVPLGCAVCAFLYYHAQGFKRHGIAYPKQFLGPIWWLSPLMLPLEIISHLARLLSLTIRLYANIFAGDMVTLVFFSLVPIGVPIIFLGLHIFVSMLQTYIFVLLTTVYLAGAVAEEH
jgi:F-type H+-transporting ATPase subunit a